MKVALATWNGRISPVFDVARQVLMLDVEEGRVVSRHEETLPGIEPQAQAERLAALAPHTLICGAISHSMADLLAAKNIRVIPILKEPLFREPMSVTTEKAQKDLIALRENHHPHCIVCGGQNDHGLKLSCQACGDGSVEGVFLCSHTFQGYDGYLHGGVISSLLDGSMCNCLFARGKIAVTGELTVRFLFPVLANRKAVVRAWIKESRAPLHMTEAKMSRQAKPVNGGNESRNYSE